MGERDRYTCSLVLLIIKWTKIHGAWEVNIRSIYLIPPKKMNKKQQENLTIFGRKIENIWID